jgi:hypothetical protein
LLDLFGFGFLHFNSLFLQSKAAADLLQEQRVLKSDFIFAKDLQLRELLRELILELQIIFTSQFLFINSDSLEWEA